MIRLEGPRLPPEAVGVIPPILFGDILLDVPGIPLQVGWAATLATRCGIDDVALTLLLGGADLAATLAAVPASGVVQLDDEWLRYTAITLGPPVRLVVAERGYRETGPAAHDQGTTVYFVETKPLYVFAFVPPGLSYAADTLVQLRVQDNAQTPPATVRLADTRLIPGVALVTVEFDASHGFYTPPPPPLPGRVALFQTPQQKAADVARATASASPLALAVRMPVSAGASRAAPSGTREVKRYAVTEWKYERPVPAPRIAPPPPPAFRAPPAPAITVSLRQGPLGSVTADLRGICDTASGRYSGVAYGRLVQPAAIVRLLMEETYGVTDANAYHTPTWTTTAAHHAARGITWRLVWTGDSFESFREAAQRCGQAELYLDEDGRWRYGFRDPTARAVMTLTPRELLGEPAVGWTAGRDVVTVLEVGWGAGRQAGAFTLTSPAMRDRHGENQGTLALPYASGDAVARGLARYDLSRRDRPRQSVTLAACHATLGLTLADKVIIDTPLLQLYGAPRVPFEVVGLTDRGADRVLTCLEADPLAQALLLSGTLLSGGAVLALSLVGTLDVGGPLLVSLSGTLVAPAVVTRTLVGTLETIGAGVLTLGLAGTRVAAATLSRSLAGTRVAPASLSRALTGTLEEAAGATAWDAVGATWDDGVSTWDA